jgi:hypothetical protein
MRNIYLLFIFLLGIVQIGSIQAEKSIDNHSISSNEITGLKVIMQQSFVDTTNEPLPYSNEQEEDDDKDDTDDKDDEDEKDDTEKSVFQSNRALLFTTQLDEIIHYTHNQYNTLSPFLTATFSPPEEA